MFNIEKRGMSYYYFIMMNIDEYTNSIWNLMVSQTSLETVKFTDLVRYDRLYWYE